LIFFGSQNVLFGAIGMKMEILKGDSFKSPIKYQNSFTKPKNKKQEKN
jgi:hypothetical protein